MRTRPRSELGPRCAVCRDERLPAISADIAAGLSNRAISRKYGFTHPVVDKHVNEHVGEALIATNIAEPVLTAIRKLNLRTLRILDAFEEKDPMIALAAIREARANLTLVGKLTGELKQTPGTDGPVKVEVIYVGQLPKAEPVIELTPVPPSIGGV